MGDRDRIRKVSAELRAASRELRRAGTVAEGVLWDALRDRRLDGLKFRRQHAVGRFMLDFYCPQHRLVLELDGDIHLSQAERDQMRTEALAAYGYQVLRFQNEEVLTSLPTVLARIRAAIQHSTSPPLPELGEGAGG